MRRNETIARPLTSDDIVANAGAYLKAAKGDLRKALEAAVRDLLDIEAEAAFRTAALDRLVSRGYIQGLASDELTGRRRDYWLRRVCTEEAKP
jgi:hypothetical protein